MLKFSLPLVIGGSMLAVGATLGTVAVAMPGLAPTPELSASATPEPTATGSGEWTTPTDPSSREVAPNIAPGLTHSNIPLGISVFQNASGVVFTYRGPCLAASGYSRVMSNAGLQQSSGQAACTVGKETMRTMSYPWDEYTRNAYCYSPAGAQSAYRFEIFGSVSAWVSIPDAYKVCVNGQRPEGAIPAPVVTPAPVAPAPAPSVTPSVSASTSASPTPTGSATP